MGAGFFGVLVLVAEQWKAGGSDGCQQESQPALDGLAVLLCKHTDAGNTVDRGGSEGANLHTAAAAQGWIHEATGRSIEPILMSLSGG